MKKSRKNKKYNPNKNITLRMSEEQFKNYENWVKFSIAYKFNLK
jgi:hypothetical protein